jgi:hypothetical protein
MDVRKPEKAEEHSMTPHVEDLIANPQRHFDHPVDVLREPTLTADEKRRILESWKLDAQRLAESTAENMSGGEESDLREVSKVLVELKQMETVPQATQASTRKNSGIVTGLAIGALLGAGAGLVVAVATGPSVAVVVQGAVVGLIIGGVAAAVRNAMRS